jgi:N-methylhydantoinase B/oxoprolinase/acetone carboxylase alpha subunit
VRGKNAILRKSGRVEPQPGKFRASLEPGDRVRVETPDGGGWGRLPKRKLLLPRGRVMCLPQWTTYMPRGM